MLTRRSSGPRLPNRSCNEHVQQLRFKGGADLHMCVLNAAIERSERHVETRMPVDERLIKTGRVAQHKC